MSGQGGLEAFFRRPKSAQENLENVKETLTPRANDLLYVRSCKACEFTVVARAAKCIVESCTEVKLKFERPLMSGTLEVINCKCVEVSVDPGIPIPTVQIEGCENIHLHMQNPQLVGDICSARSSNIVLHFEPPFTKEQTLGLPPLHEQQLDDQYVSSLSGDKMVTVKGIREGAGYLTTPERKETADKREAELLRRLEISILSTLSIGPKKQKQQQPAGPKQRSPQQQGDGGTKPLPATSSSPQDQPEQTNPGAGNNGGVAEGSLADELAAKKGKLKPTETVVRNMPVVGGLNPAIHKDAEKKEYFDSAELLARKLDKAASWVKESKHIILFTGAGISTSCGIPDYRSGMDTVLSTGPGVWELRAHGSGPLPSSRQVPLLKALPSPTHMAIVQLHQGGVVKCTVSQNVDGLHRRSGLDPAHLAELHGNTNLETCQKCQRQYLRDFETREALHVFDHKTSRLCDDPECGGILEDSIVNFGEPLPQDELQKAFSHAEKADLCIVLGSSLRVRPACQVPVVVHAIGGRVIVCNLQVIPHLTPGARNMQVFCKCDDFMTGLMKRLDCDIPPFTLKRRARVSCERKNDSCVLAVTGLDVDKDTPYSFIKSVTVRCGEQEFKCDKEPFQVTIPCGSACCKEEGEGVGVTLGFHGHYGEPPLEVKHSSSCEGPTVYIMTYDPYHGTWTTST